MKSWFIGGLCIYKMYFNEGPPENRSNISSIDVFHVVMKHSVECLILLLKQNVFSRRNQGCKNEQFFI